MPRQALAGPTSVLQIVASRPSNLSRSTWVGVRPRFWIMAMGKKKRQQESMWLATGELPKSPGHPFYQRLNVVLHSPNRDAGATV